MVQKKKEEEKGSPTQFFFFCLPPFHEKARTIDLDFSSFFSCTHQLRFLFL